MNHKKIKWNIVLNIKTVCDTVHEKNLKIDRTKKYVEALKRLTNYFGASEKEVWILGFALWYQMTNSENEIKLGSFAEFLGTNVLYAASLNKEFCNLEKRGYINYDSIKGEYSLTKELIHAVMNNQNLPQLSSTNISYTDFIFAVQNKINNLKYEEKAWLEIDYALEKLEDYYSDLTFIKACKDKMHSQYERYIFYCIASEFLSYPTFSTNLDQILDYFYKYNAKYKVARQFMDGSHILIKNGYVEFSNKENLNDATVKLTEKGMRFLLGSDYELYEKQISDDAVIKPADIQEHKMFYNKENLPQITRLNNILDDKNFERIRNQLSSRGMRKGISIVLYGGPGTGKSETVMQLAKKTGRGIFLVDISDTKSCWYGESEKKIKELFDNYKKLCKRFENEGNKNIPILLFNEADAVLSRRREVKDSNIAQTENAIQNIILNEMDNFTGIMIATTNLIENLDPAFERRFLFKVQLQNPDAETKKALWRDKLSFLNEKQAQKLASEYPFSGGQIENVSRKICMEEIICGQKPGFDFVTQACKEELFLHEGKCKCVGFSM